MKKPKIEARLMGVYCTTDGAFLVSPKWEPVARFADAEQAASTVLVIPFDDPDALVEQMARAITPGVCRDEPELLRDARHFAKEILKSLGVSLRSK
jgi:hypothetical protein